LEDFHAREGPVAKEAVDPFDDEGGLMLEQCCGSPAADADGEFAAVATAFGESDRFGLGELGQVGPHNCGPVAQQVAFSQAALAKDRLGDTLGKDTDRF
jgi:hypothetical protein